MAKVERVSEYTVKLNAKEYELLILALDHLNFEIAKEEGFTQLDVMSLSGELETDR
jgi:DNA-binding CsgD family transcriptional regulator